MAVLWNERKIRSTNFIMRTYVRVEGTEEVIGNIADGGCENPACKRAIREGRPIHMVPTGQVTPLETYHFATWEEAEEEMDRVMVGMRGLRMDLPLEQRIAWWEGKDISADS